MKPLIFSLLLCICYSLPAQGPLNVSWFKVQDGPAALSDFAWGVETDGAGNVYWATSQTIGGFSQRDILTYKFDASGNDLWAAPYRYDKIWEQQAYNCVFKDGELFVGGYAHTGWDRDTGILLLFSLDTLTRDTLWSFTWDSGPGYEEIDGIVVEDSAIFISGWAQDSVNDQVAFVMRLDRAGNMEWVTTWGTPGDDSCDGHCVVDDSLIYIGGGIGNFFIRDAFLAAFSKDDGSYRWHTTWGGPGGETALGTYEYDGNLYQCGVTGSNGDSLVFILKYDFSGNLLWQALTNKAYRSRSMAFSGDRIYLAATTDSAGSNNDDIIVMEFDTAGNFYQYRTWGGANREAVHDIRIDGNAMYLTGRTESFGGNIVEDAFLIKAPLFTTTALDPEPPAMEITLYPNPAQDQALLTFPNVGREHCHLEIWDVNGRRVGEMEGGEEGRMLVATGRLSSGLYFFRLSTESGAVGHGKFVVD